LYQPDHPCSSLAWHLPGRALRRLRPRRWLGAAAPRDRDRPETGAALTKPAAGLQDRPRRQRSTMFP